MRLILTGAGGFVGSHVLEHFLVNTDAQLVLTDSFRHRGVSERITEVLDSHDGSRDRVQVITHDLTSPWSAYGTEQLLADGPIDTIVQVASESHVDRSISDPVPFVRNNVDVALNMLELARAIRPRLYVHLSTDEVYGAVPLGRPAVEWDPILPSNPYSASKAAQEAICISYWRTYDVPLILVNAMNLIGERQHPEKFIPKVIRAVMNGDAVPIHASADGTEIGRRCYLHARNLADAILFIIRELPPRLHKEDAFPQRFHVVGEEADNLSMAQKIAEFSGKPLRYELVDFHGQRPGHDLAYLMDGSKLRRMGWKPPVDLWSSLERVVHWTLVHPTWLHAD